MKSFQALPSAMTDAEIRREFEDEPRREEHDADLEFAFRTDDGQAIYVGADHNGDPIEATTGGADPERITRDARPSARPKSIAENTSYRDVVMALRQTDVCDTCGKTRVLLNNAGHRGGYHEERPNPAIHCTCVGGPAYAGIGGTVGGAR